MTFANDKLLHLQTVILINCWSFWYHIVHGCCHVFKHTLVSKNFPQWDFRFIRYALVVLTLNISVNNGMLIKYADYVEDV